MIAANKDFQYRKQYSESRQTLAICWVHDSISYRNRICSCNSYQLLVVSGVVTDAYKLQTMLTASDLCDGERSGVEESRTLQFIMVSHSTVLNTISCDAVESWRIPGHLDCCERHTVHVDIRRRRYDCCNTTQLQPMMARVYTDTLTVQFINSTFRPHRMQSVHKMRPIATDGVAWSVCLSVGHVHEPCKNGWTNQDADWRADSGGPKKPCITWGSRFPPEGQF